MALTNGFEAGTNGATVAITDRGDATPWDTVTIDANATLKYDGGRAYRTLAARITSVTGSPCTASMGWTTAWGTQTDHYGRVYIYPSTLWAVDSFLGFEQAGGVGSGGFVIDNTNHLLLKDAAGATITGTAAALTLNAWNRIEWHIVHSATVGQFEVKVFYGANADGTVPDETITPAATQNMNTNSTVFVIGLRNNDPGITFWLDNIVGAATAYPGPASRVTRPVFRRPWPLLSLEANR